MTIKDLENDWLSLRCWAVRCVLPSAIFLVILLGLLRLVTGESTVLDHNAVIIGFFILYFVLVRGGHIIMIRSMHHELLANYRAPYTQKLEHLPKRERSLFGKRHNIGFTLAKIKRELIDEFGAR